jgi:hypothetical protein
MRTKLTLNLEDLSVDSFDTTSTHKAKGTVFGEQCTCYTNCTCPGCPTCDRTCRNTCAYTCDDATCVYTCDDASCAGTCNCGTDNTCGWGYTCGDCTALQTNCNQICL